MVEFANRLQVQEGFGRREAIELAASVRLRPILMTTAAMVVGMVPLIVAEGAGAKSRFAIGIVIAAGMSIGTIFTLFVTPAIYTLIARNHGGKRGEVAFVLKVDDKPARRAAEGGAHHLYQYAVVRPCRRDNPSPRGRWAFRRAGPHARGLASGSGVKRGGGLR